MILPLIIPHGGTLVHIFKELRITRLSSSDIKLQGQEDFVALEKLSKLKLQLPLWFTIKKYLDSTLSHTKQEIIYSSVLYYKKERFQVFFMADLLTLLYKNVNI